VIMVFHCICSGLMLGLLLLAWTKTHAGCFHGFSGPKAPDAFRCFCDNAIPCKREHYPCFFCFVVTLPFQLSRSVASSRRASPGGEAGWLEDLK